MELTQSQFQRIADCLPRQRGNVGMTNLQLLNALLYVVEHFFLIFLFSLLFFWFHRLLRLYPLSIVFPLVPVLPLLIILFLEAHLPLVLAKFQPSTPIIRGNQMNLGGPPPATYLWLAGRFFSRPGAIGVYFHDRAVQHTCSMWMAKICSCCSRAKTRSNTPALLQRFIRV